MNYLNHFNKALVKRHEEMFIDGARASEEEFFRDSERHQTIQDLIDIQLEDIEAFYDDTSVGKTSRKTD
jgi:hypothetical protein